MSRSNARSRQLRRRSSRTVPATVVAVVLLALGVLAAWVATARLVNGSWPGQVSVAASAVAGLTWGSTPIVASGAVLAVLGVVLLVAGLKPGSFKTAQLRPPDPVTGADGANATNGVSGTTELDFVITTRAMARIAAARADSVDGVDGVSASASGRRVLVRVDTTSEQAVEIRDRVSERVSQALSAAGLQPTPRVTVTVRTKGI